MINAIVIVRSIVNSSRAIPVRSFVTTGNSDGTYNDLVKVPEPRRSGVMTSYKRGTGGRSSFSGVVATVFGAGGQVGENVVNQLGKIGSQVIIPYRRDAYHYRQMKLSGDLGQILFLPYNMMDETSVRKCIKYSNVVINLVGSEINTKNFTMDDTNNKVARMVARLSREAGVERLIHFSAMNASLEPEEKLIPGGSVFLRTKAKGEIAVRDEFPDATIIRPGPIHSIGDRFINSILHAQRHYNNNKYECYERGENTYKLPIFAGDVGRGVGAVVTDPTTIGQTFEFVGPYCYQWGNLSDWLYRKVNRGEEYGYSRRNLGAFHSSIVNFLECFNKPYRRTPRLSWEWTDYMEATSDVLTGCPTLFDLGLYDLATVESKCQRYIKRYDSQNHYFAEWDEVVEPPPPKHYQPLRSTGVAFDSYQQQSQAY